MLVFCNIVASYQVLLGCQYASTTVPMAKLSLLQKTSILKSLAISPFGFMVIQRFKLKFIPWNAKKIKGKIFIYSENKLFWNKPNFIEHVGKNLKLHENELEEIWYIFTEVYFWLVVNSAEKIFCHCCYNKNMKA